MSEQKGLKQLLQDIDLGDLRPSQLLREMRNLAGNQVDDALLKSMWMTRLPSHMTAIISVSSEPLDKIALMADKISEVNDGSTIQAISTPPTETTLQKQVEKLINEVASLKTQLRSRSRNRSNSYNRDRKNTREHSQSNGLCWYHQKFGADAKKCKEPCSKNLN